MPKCITSNPVAAEAIEGMNTATGVQEGHFTPTNKENAVGATKQNYFAHETEKIQRPQFRSKPRKRQIGPQPLPSEKRGPSEMAEKLIGDLQCARPKDFFDTQITPVFVSKVMVNCTNARAASKGARAGGMMYQNWHPFDTLEVYRMIGLLFANGLSPKPAMEQWFQTTYDNRLFGNNYVSAAMDKMLPRGGKVGGLQRWRYLRCFSCYYDFRVNPKVEAAKNPLWKVESLLDELNTQARKMWTTG